MRRLVRRLVGEGALRVGRSFVNKKEKQGRMRVEVDEVKS